MIMLLVCVCVKSFRTYFCRFECLGWKDPTCKANAGSFITIQSAKNKLSDNSLLILKSNGRKLKVDPRTLNNKLAASVSKTMVIY